MKKFQRIGAVIVIILLLSMYLICFIAAVSGSESLQPLFKITLGMTVALPVLLYVFILFLRLASKNKVEIRENENSRDGEAEGADRTAE
ncbi:MAG: hypothetical protein J5496_07445 [Lachnospiraceae bacterium]|nr:hypothetical protein [Lachnospiraceae bacterium]